MSAATGEHEKENPKLDDETLEKRFNCVKCSIKLKDVKLLKLHYWKVHISNNDILKAKQELENPSVKSVSVRRRAAQKTKRVSSYTSSRSDDTATPAGHKSKSESKKRKLSTNGSSKKNSNKKRLSVSDSSNKGDDDDEMSTDDSLLNSTIEEPPNEFEIIDEQLRALTSEEIKTYNLAKDIDEAELVKKYRLVNQTKPYDKMKELKSGKIVWAAWRSKGKTIWWPSKVDRLVKGKSQMRVFIRYYELSRKQGNIFKLDPSKVELFFRSVDDHIGYKELACENLEKRYEFFMTYSNALEDFVKLASEEELKVDEEEVVAPKAPEIRSIKKLEPFKKAATNKHLVYNKTLTIEEITELAHKPLSEEQLKVNQERAEYSKKLIDLCNTGEFKDHIKSILTNSTECWRHTAYLKADFIARKKMKMSSPGPLIDEHQKELATILIKLSETHFTNKPSNLTTYEYDVLYPEAVIWALMKLEDLSYKKAEFKYKNGFKRTQEESIKQRCNEILNKCPKQSSEDADKSIVTDLKQIENRLRNVEEDEEMNEADADEDEKDTSASGDDDESKKDVTDNESKVDSSEKEKKVVESKQEEEQNDENSKVSESKLELKSDSKAESRPLNEIENQVANAEKTAMEEAETDKSQN